MGQKAGILTKQQAMKGYNFTLTKNDFKTPKGDYDNSRFEEACKRFPWFPMETFQIVKDPGGRKCSFKLFKVQKYMEKLRIDQLKYYNYVHLWLLKFRQGGLSTYFGRAGLHHAMWYQHECKIIAHSKGTTGETVIFNQYVRDGHDHMVEQAEIHPFLKPYVEIDRLTKQKIVYSKGGSIELLASSSDAVGFACQHGHLSEVSRFEDFPAFWGSFTQSLHTAYYHNLAVESTAFYSGPFFLDVFEQQIALWKKHKRPPALRPVFIPCYMHEEYAEEALPEGYQWSDFWDEADLNLYGDEEKMTAQMWYDPFWETETKLPLTFWKWRRDKIYNQQPDKSRGFSKLQVFQENFPMSYQEARLIAGDSVFDKVEIMRRKSIIVPPMFTGDLALTEEKDGLYKNGSARYDIHHIENEINPHYRRWDVAREGFEYFIGVDTKNERAGDSAVAICYSYRQNTPVAVLEIIEPDTHFLVENLIPMGMYWNNALIAWESILLSVSDTILKKMFGNDFVNPIGAPYYNVYWRKVDEDVVWGSSGSTIKYGIHSSGKKKESYVELTTDVLADPESNIWIPELLDQMLIIRRKPNREGEIRKAPSAPKNKHDDYWDAFGISLFVARDAMQRGEMRDQMGKYSVDKSVSSYYEGMKQWEEDWKKKHVNPDVYADRNNHHERVREQAHDRVRVMSR